jgi:hypothetical protein
MTPTPTFILLVALFWTLPASVATLTYRRHGSFVENVKAVFKLKPKDASEALSPQLQPEA